ncbi:hypothetical protein [Streptomyces hainanensis]|uniref:Uncharacterized protein n=1 Tax=Streptomyces hainanensis TaxID=402648 RepID=A0A4R4T0H0_9ACTN|nr:hypothetical protein [Streptomyces hainanensis]TDC70200.1 hypothetical protein E1283_25085 [Streptomyces hainanensis]
MSPLYDWLASLWRTFVPYAVSWAVVQAARVGVELDNATVTSALTAAAGTTYYGVVRYAEQRLGSHWGWLLGLARPPSYSRPAEG